MREKRAGKRRNPIVSLGRPRRAHAASPKRFRSAARGGDGTDSDGKDMPLPEKKQADTLDSVHYCEGEEVSGNPCAMILLKPEKTEWGGALPLPSF